MRIRIAAAGVLVALLLVCVGLTWTRFDHCPNFVCDFDTYWMQAQQLQRPDFKVVEGWYYPPSTALFFLPFKWVPLKPAASLWLGITLIATALFIRQVARGFPDHSPARAHALAAGLSLTSLPLLHCIKWGQPGLIIAVLCIWALRSTKGRPALIAVAAAIKVYPAGYALVWLMRRRYGLVLRSAAITLALALVLPLLVLGWDAFRALWIVTLDRSFLAASAEWDYGHTMAWWGGQGYAAWMLRLFIDGSHMQPAIFNPAFTGSPTLAQTTPLFFSLPAPVVTALTLGLIGGTVVVTLWALRRPSVSADVAIALVMTCVSLVLKPAWHHYFVFLPFAHAVILGQKDFPLAAKVLSLAAWGITALPFVVLLFEQNAFVRYSQLSGTTLAAVLTFVALTLSARAETSKQAE